MVVQTILEEWTAAIMDRPRPVFADFGRILRRVIYDNSGIRVTEALEGR